MDKDIEELVDKLKETPEIKAAILVHLRRQDGVEDGFVKWDDGSIHRIGEDADDDRR